MGIEKKMILDDRRTPVDVTTLEVGTGYELLREVGPYYVRTGRVGVISRRVDFGDTGDTVAVVSELVRNGDKLEKIKRLRFSSAVVKVGVRLITE